VCFVKKFIMLQKDESNGVNNNVDTNGVVVYSVQNQRIYIALVLGPNGIWDVLYCSSMEGGADSTVTNLVSRVKEVLSVEVVVDKEHLGDFTVGDPSRKVNFFFAETGHTPLYLVNKGNFSEVKWFLQEDVKNLKVCTGLPPVLEKVYKTVPERNNSSSWKKASTLILVLGALIFIGYFAGVKFVDITQRKATSEKEAQRHDAFYAGILKNDPKQLQNDFLTDIKIGVNDKYTKSDAYFVTHRYFDNGGNIYEVYDYVNSHPELAFMKEAEQIYPKVFQRIRENKIDRTFVDASYYAYLAYVEVLYKHGYTDIAAVSTLANQYAKMAYYNVTISREMSEKDGAERRKNSKNDALKAAEFIKAAKPDVDAILSGKMTDRDLTQRDILVGLNQYAAASRYLDALLIAVNMPTSTMPDSYRNSRQVFSFAKEYSHKNVPELILFTSLLDASTLAILNDSTPQEIKVALFPILDFNTKTGKLSPNSIIHKILNSRFEQKPVDIGSTNMDIYSKRNTLRLAKKVPEFKLWLKYNGWQDSDFK
jgi:hypothetical protein